MRITEFAFFVLVFFVLSACASTGAKNASQVSDQTAQDFTLPDQDGKLWKLNDAVTDYRAVILTFYPKKGMGFALLPDQTQTLIEEINRNIK